MNNQAGVGIEMEGFIVDQTNRGTEEIEGVPASEWTKNKVTGISHLLADKISFEQASVMLEIKSDIYPRGWQAVEQILEIRWEIDKVLQEKGLRLIFQPVLQKEFKFIPATSDLNSRTAELVDRWSKTPEGIRNLYRTVIAGLQVNDSRPFAGIKSEKEKWEKCLKIHNLMGEAFEEMDAFNLKMKNYEGKTRMELLYDLMRAAKGEFFKKMGFKGEWDILIPPHFDSIEEMHRWMMAHAGAEDIAGLNCKDEHAATVKIKRSNGWIAESRTHDSVEGEEEINKRVSQAEQLLNYYL